MGTTPWYLDPLGYPATQHLADRRVVQTFFYRPHFLIVHIYREPWTGYNRRLPGVLIREVNHWPHSELALVGYCAFWWGVGPWLGLGGVTCWEEVTNPDSVRRLQKSINRTSSSKCGAVHEKFIFLEMQELRPLRTCPKHFETILPNFILDEREI